MAIARGSPNQDQPPPATGSTLALAGPARSASAASSARATFLITAKYLRKDRTASGRPSPLLCPSMAAPLLDDLVDWLRIPSISTGGGDPADIARAAEWVCE